MKTYYKIWVSLFLKIKEAQNGNEKAALILSLIVLTTTNIINYFLLSYLSITLIGVNINLMNLMSFENRFISIALTALLFLIPNYLILVFNGKDQQLLDEFSKQKGKNLGLRYFIVSCVLVIAFVFLMILFPQSFGLAAK